MSIRLSAWKMSAVYTYYISVRLLRLLVQLCRAIPEPLKEERATKYRFSRYSFLLFLKPKRRVRRQPIYHMKKFLSLLCAAVIGFSNLTHAYDFEVDGICYNILSETDRTVEVTNSGSSQNKYEGDIVIPSSVISNETTTYTVTTIGENAFNGCKSLVSVTFPESLTAIGGYAFFECDALVNVTFNEFLKIIGEEAFWGCGSLKSISFPKSLTNIGEEAFCECTCLTSIIFQENSSLETIGKAAFMDCRSLISVTFPESLSTLGDFAFFDCYSLESIIFPENCLLSDIGTMTFYCCEQLTSVSFPKLLTNIGMHAFRFCSSLSSVRFPENSNISFVGYQAFQGCSSLTSVDFPESLNFIGEWAFSACFSLTLIENRSKTPQIITENVFESRVYDNAVLKVPDGYVDAYKEADVWKLFSKIEDNTSSGIEDVAQDEGPVTVYTLGGIVVYTGLWNERPKLPAGMYIVRNADGTSRKVAIR